jgi:AraC-like DNA-binding protein
MCDDCKARWYFSSRLMLNDVLEEQCQKMRKFTETTGKEFGALLVKTPEGIRLDMIDVGQDTSVTFKKTKEYRTDEQVIGSIHVHPYTNFFSSYDISSFLHDSWEKISMLVGADGSLNVMVKTKNTIQVTDIQKWIEENKDLPPVEVANKFQFILFKGKVNNLKLLAGVSNMSVTSLETLFKQVSQ